MGDRLGLTFVPFALEQAGELAPLLHSHPQPLSGYTVSMLAAWDATFHYEWAHPALDSTVISCTVDPEPHRHLIQPVGAVSEGLQQQIVEGAQRLAYPLKIYGVSERFLAEHPDFVAHFEIARETLADNYVYSAADLALLAGRKYAAKRNHIAQAARDFQWATAPLRPGDADECISLAHRIFAESDGSRSFLHDLQACEVALRHLELLRLRGTVVRVDGHLEAFAIWEALEPTTAVVHFERALRTHKGLYQVVNQETAKVMLAEGFELINREEDLGDEGLRKAKLSYHPVRLEKCFTLTFRR